MLHKLLLYFSAKHKERQTTIRAHSHTYTPDSPVNLTCSACRRSPRGMRTDLGTLHNLLTERQQLARGVQPRTSCCETTVTPYSADFL